MTPIFVAPLAGAVSDRIGRRPLIVAGLALQALGFGWLAVRASTGVNLAELLLALFVAGVGISMAIPAVPTAVLGFRPALAVCALLSLLGAAAGLALKRRAPAPDLEPAAASAAG
jgi:MFS family permease